MNKKGELSFLNVLFCLLVIFIHVLSAPVSSLLKDSLAYAAVFVPWRLSAFVVQGFIFLSGLKMFLNFDSEKSFDYKSYYLSRVKRILIPYIVFVCIFYVYFCNRGYFEADFPELLKYILIGNLVAHFYFVIVIMQFYILRPVWKEMLLRVRPGFGIFAALIISLAAKKLVPELIFSIMGREFIYNDRIFTTYLIYWVMGCYAGAHYEQAKELLKKKTAAVFAGFSVLAALEALLGLICFSGRGSFEFLEELHLFYCIAAIMLCARLSLGCGRIGRIRLFSVIDRTSYYIYLIHPLFIFIIDEKMSAYRLSVSQATAIRTVFTYVCAVAAAWAIVWGLKKGKEVRICRNLKGHK